MLLNHKILGSGDPVVLIHGLFGTLDNLGRLAKYLSENHQVISIDLPNHGGSFHSDSVSYQAIADDVLALLDHLGITQCAFVGHSMGGKVAMEFALYHPQHVSSLVVADIAPVAYTNRHSDVFAALNAVDLANIENRQQAQATVMEHGIDQGTAMFLLKNLAKGDDGYFWRCNLAALENAYPAIIGGLTPALQYDGPVLFIKGQLSDYITSEHKEQIGAHFSNASLKVIQGTGHWLHAEKPASFNKIVNDFLVKNKVD